MIIKTEFKDITADDLFILWLKEKLQPLTVVKLFQMFVDFKSEKLTNCININYDCDFFRNKYFITYIQSLFIYNRKFNLISRSYKLWTYSWQGWWIFYFCCFISLYLSYFQSFFVLKEKKIYAVLYNFLGVNRI